MSQQLIMLSPEELQQLVARAVKNGIMMAKEEIESKKIFNEADTAKYLGLSTSVVRQMRSQGRGPEYSKVGGSVRYRKSDIDSYINKNMVLTYD